MVTILLIITYFNVKRVRKFISIIYKINNDKEDYKADGKLTEWFVGSNEEEDHSEKQTPDDEEEGARTNSATAIPQNRRQGLERYASEYVEGPSIGLYIVGAYLWAFCCLIVCFRTRSF